MLLRAAASGPVPEVTCPVGGRSEARMTMSAQRGTWNYPPHDRLAHLSAMIGKEIRETLHLGLPLMLAQLGQMSMSFIDTLMVGRLGGLDLAGVALAGAIFHPVTFVCLGVLMAVGPLVSQAHGARDPSRAGRAVRQHPWPRRERGRGRQARRGGRV